ncbi:sporulation initiation factor Spo0A C-terminal domain-containing protein [Desulfosporosinus sp.]|uniref:sporulation initiation factor Spo0A C-terminal domain-containing protein n=1 Tax=Desulfosporosinus sp. TaxID=157907 RepID=UPI00230883A9|nr:sporulation initiation factor Spo0A C-terminal domain-containing protein [Desulfosporosinus sp.]MCO5384513.1 sporulation initiation factor Spo0A C-terminal domain-containing protein [Desulfosporosinus sp.]MDA8220640.1 sporulation initiation factor Spo0A [Desulfitobacterium hafniense]
MNMRNIYRKIAKEHGVTVAEVKREMQAAIDFVYKKIDKSESEKIMQERNTS